MNLQDDPRATWNRVADAWDTHVDYVNTHAAAATGTLLDALAIQPGERVVEMAGGPGTLGRRWAELVGPDGDVLVSDLAPAMVEAATRRLAALPNVRTACLDLADIELPEQTADVAVCRFGLMFTPQPEQALAELHRILSPGGRLGVMTWADMTHNPWVACVGMAAMATGILTGGPPVGPGQLFSLSDPARLVALAREAGFSDASVNEADIDFVAPDPDTHVDMVEKLAGPLAAAFATATPDQIAALRAMATENSAQFATDTGYRYPGQALVLTAHHTG